MKKIGILISIATVLLISCSKDVVKNDRLYGKWQLTEYYIDAGNGSGTWQPAHERLSVEFTRSGEFIQYTGNGNDTTNFTLLSDSTLQINTSNASPFLPYRYELKDNNATLFLYPPCIEGCGYKYTAIHKD
ncbi:MAG: hypothetical protein ACTHJ5_04505 [Ilyomonas sp.]